jgi:hypothetical protein
MTAPATNGTVAGVNASKNQMERKTPQMKKSLPASLLLLTLTGWGCGRTITTSDKGFQWGKVANGLEAGIAIAPSPKVVTKYSLDGFVVKLQIRNAGSKPARILPLSRYLVHRMTQTIQIVHNGTPCTYRSPWPEGTPPIPPPPSEFVSLQPRETNTTEYFIPFEPWGLDSPGTAGITFSFTNDVPPLPGKQELADDLWTGTARSSVLHLELK